VKKTFTKENQQKKLRKLWESGQEEGPQPAGGKAPSPNRDRRKQRRTARPRQDEEGLQKSNRTRRAETKSHKKVLKRDGKKSINEHETRAGPNPPMRILAVYKAAEKLVRNCARMNHGPKRGETWPAVPIREQAIRRHPMKTTRVSRHTQHVKGPFPAPKLEERRFRRPRRGFGSKTVSLKAPSGDRKLCREGLMAAAVSNGDGLSSPRQVLREWG